MAFCCISDLFLLISLVSYAICFSIQPPGLIPVPDKISAVEDDVQFYHYLKGDREGREVSPGCTECISSFVKGARLIIFAHGYGHPEGHLSGFARDIREGFESRPEPVNMIIINWAKLSPTPLYGQAVRNVPVVGEYTARLLNFLVDEGIANVNDIHFFGHSLGAHVANYVSQHMTGENILYRVFGLDPAMPLFISMDDSKRLSPEDAKSVVVLHTSMGILGMIGRVGHADFYPNSGTQQPGCDDDLAGNCSHGRVMYLIAESIQSQKAFPSCSCESWTEFNEGRCSCDEKISMGWDTSMNATGAFFLRTNSDSPYSIAE